MLLRREAPRGWARGLTDCCCSLPRPSLLLNLTRTQTLQKKDLDEYFAVISPRWSVSRGPCWYVAVLGGVSLGDFRTLGEAKAAVKAKL